MNQLQKTNLDKEDKVGSLSAMDDLVVLDPVIVPAESRRNEDEESLPEEDDIGSFGDLVRGTKLKKKKRKREKQHIPDISHIGKDSESDKGTTISGHRAIHGGHGKSMIIPSHHATKESDKETTISRIFGVRNLGDEQANSPREKKSSRTGLNIEDILGDEDDSIVTSKKHKDDDKLIKKKVHIEREKKSRRHSKHGKGGSRRKGHRKHKSALKPRDHKKKKVRFSGSVSDTGSSASSSQGGGFVNLWADKKPKKKSKKHRKKKYKRKYSDSSDDSSSESSDSSVSYVPRRYSSSSDSSETSESSDSSDSDSRIMGTYRSMKKRRGHHHHRKEEVIENDEEVQDIKECDRNKLLAETRELRNTASMYDIAQEVLPPPCDEEASYRAIKHEHDLIEEKIDMVEQTEAIKDGIKLICQLTEKIFDRYDVLGIKIEKWTMDEVGPLLERKERVIQRIYMRLKNKIHFSPEIIILVALIYNLILYMMSGRGKKRKARDDDGPVKKVRPESKSSAPKDKVVVNKTPSRGDELAQESADIEREMEEYRKRRAEQDAE